MATIMVNKDNLIELFSKMGFKEGTAVTTEYDDDEGELIITKAKGILKVILDNYDSNYNKFVTGLIYGLKGIKILDEGCQEEEQCSGSYVDYILIKPDINSEYLLRKLSNLDIIHIENQ